GELTHRQGRPVIHTQWKSGTATCSRGNKIPVGLRDNEGNARVVAKDRNQRLGVKMVRVVVAGGNDGDSLKQFGIHNPFTHSDMRLVSVRIFLRKGIRQVRIDKNALPLPLQEKAALSQPPQVKITL